MAELLVNKLAVTQLGSTVNGTFLTEAQTATLLGGGGGAVGQAFYGFGDGQYSWTCPPGVTSVCVVCIGGGASNLGPTWAAGGGGGGGLGWKNNIPVTPGQSYLVQVGRGGDIAAQGNSSGTSSFFIDPSIVAGLPGSGATGGGFVGDGGGNGGNAASNYGGGGAGGYTGNGGGAAGTSGSGGGGAGGAQYSSTYGSSGGGGTGPFGQGASGVLLGQAAGGGSGGETSSAGENPSTSAGNIHRPGGLYGGGGGGPGSTAPANLSVQRGGRGCVRIIWGAGRSFPSTGTGDM